MKKSIKNKVSVLLLLTILVITGIPIAYYADENSTEIVSYNDVDNIITNYQELDDTHLYSIELDIKEVDAFESIAINGDYVDLSTTNYTNYINAQSLELIIDLKDGYKSDDVFDYTLTDMGEMYSFGDISSTTLQSGYYYDIFINSIDSNNLFYGEETYQLNSGSNHINLLALENTEFVFANPDLITEIYTVEIEKNKEDDVVSAPIEDEDVTPIEDEDVTPIEDEVDDTKNLESSVGKTSNTEISPMALANSTITTTIVDENADGKVERGETLANTISITNKSSSLSLKSVPIRNSFTEAIGNGTVDYATLGSIYIDNPFIASDGNLSDGTYVVEEIPPGETINIKYNIFIKDEPLDTSLISIVSNSTDNGDDPTVYDPSGICPSGVQPDCSGIVIDIKPETYVETTMVDQDGDGIAQPGETLTYNIKVSNPSAATANNVVLRSELIEEIDSGKADYATFDETSVTTTAATSGSLSDGTFTILEIPGLESVDVSFEIKVTNSIVDKINNNITDNGKNPSIEHFRGNCDLGEQTNCSSSSIPLLVPNTNLELSVADQNGDGVAQPGEILTYNIKVTNTTLANAYNVAIRSSLIEEMTIGLVDYATLDESSIVVSPSSSISSGNLLDGSFSLAEIPAGESVDLSFKVDITGSSVTEIQSFATDNGDVPGPSLICEEGEADNCSYNKIELIVPETNIKKIVVDENYDGNAQPGEVLTYTIKVTNPTTVDAYNVVVRDSLIEAIALATAEYATFDETSVTTTAATSGSLLDGTYTIDSIPSGKNVTISYTILMSDNLNAISDITNNATDNGDNPISYDPSGICGESVQPDCSGVSIPVVLGDTSIEKTVVDENGDKFAEIGETLTYTLKVSNKTTIDVKDAHIRDGLVETIASGVTDYATFDETSVKISPDTVVATGSLSDGTYTILDVPAGDDVSISFDITIVGSTVTNVVNNATDNGENPDTAICKVGKQDDCSKTTTQIAYSDTAIEKTIVDESGDNKIQPGESLTYTLEITNPSVIDAKNIVVRDDLVEAIGNGDVDYATFDESSIALSSTDVISSGSLVDGTYTLDKIRSGESVSISFDIVMKDDLSAITEVVNNASDNGQDPTTLTCAANQQSDCSSVVMSVEMTPIVDDYNTTIDKSVINIQDNYKVGDVIDYKIMISNDTEVDCLNVNVRDSLLEETPSYIAYNDDVTVLGSEFSGNFKDKNFTLNKVPANQTVEITYSIVITDAIPNEQLINIATDDGTVPSSLDTSEDSDFAVLKLTGDNQVEGSNDDNQVDDQVATDSANTEVLFTGNNIIFTIILLLAISITLILIKRRLN